MCLYKEHFFVNKIDTHNIHLSHFTLFPFVLNFFFITNLFSSIFCFNKLVSRSSVAIQGESNGKRNNNVDTDSSKSTSLQRRKLSTMGCTNEGHFQISRCC